MSSVEGYVQHEYSVNEPCLEPWSLNSNQTELSSVLDGDEELLILDNSRLAFDDDFALKQQEDEDFCRCDNCSTNNRRNCLSNLNNNNNTINRNFGYSNGIAMISTGNVIDEVNHWNHMSSTNSLEPSNQTFTHFNHQINQSNGHQLSADDQRDSPQSRDHNWLTHCHPSQANSTRSQAVTKANRQLLIGCILCLVFMLAEVIGGILSNSLAIMTDAAHLLSDLASFLLSLFAIWISQKQPTKRMSFGFYRAEVLGAVTSIFMIWVLTGVLVYLAIDRIRHHDYEINSDAMLIVSGLGVAMNIVMGLTLSDVFCGKKPADPEADGHPQGGGHNHSHSHSHSHSSHGHSHTNMNVRAAMIHVLGDLIQSIGVLIAALIIHFKPEYKIADPISTFIFSALVMFTTYSIMKDAVLVLMEGFPSHLDYSSVKKDLLDIEDVQSAHSLHIWSLTLNKNALSVHLAIKHDSDPERVLKMAESLIRKKYDIQQTTIQVERFDARAMNNCLTCKGPKDT